jgi:hypothetical protein
MPYLGTNPHIHLLSPYSTVDGETKMVKKKKLSADDEALHIVDNLSPQIREFVDEIFGNKHLSKFDDEKTKELLFDRFCCVVVDTLTEIKCK